MKNVLVLFSATAFSVIVVKYCQKLQLVMELNKIIVQNLEV